MDHSTPFVSATTIVTDLLDKLHQFHVELCQAGVEVNPPVERINTIVNQVFQVLGEALTSFQNRSDHSFHSSDVTYNPPTFSLSELEQTKLFLNANQISDKIIKTKLFIEKVERSVVAISTKVITQEDSVVLDEIRKVYENVKGLLQRNQVQAEILLGQQQYIQPRIALLQDKMEILDRFQSHCNQLRQLLTQMGQRTDRVEIDYRQFTSQAEANRSSISSNADQVTAILQEVSAHMEELSGIQTELQEYTTDVEKHGQDVAETTEAASDLTEKVTHHLKDVDDLQNGFLSLQASLTEIQRSLEPPQPIVSSVLPAVISNGQEGEGLAETIVFQNALVQRLFTWLMNAAMWYKQAYDRTSSEIAKVMEKVSQFLRPRLTPCLGAYKAAIITHPKTWVAIVILILLWKGRLQKATMSYIFACGVFHLTCKPTTPTSTTPAS